MKTPEYSREDLDLLVRKYRLAKRVVLTSLAFFIMLFSINNLHWEHGSLFRWLVQCVPLLLFIPGLYLGHHRTYSWLCFLILFYFIGFVTQAMAPHGNSYHYLTVGLSVVIFIAAMMASRWRQHARLARRQNLPTPDHS